jgi:hypothetical protein
VCVCVCVCVFIVEICLRKVVGRGCTGPATKSWRPRLGIWLANDIGPLFCGVFVSKLGITRLFNLIH